MTTIRTLNLSNNKFVAWPATTFAQTSITMLNLSQNKLEMIPREVGLFHTVLKSLNLSQNTIVNLPLAQSILTFVVLPIPRCREPETGNRWRRCDAAGCCLAEDRVKQRARWCGRKGDQGDAQAVCVVGAVLWVLVAGDCLQKSVKRHGGKHRGAALS